MRRAAWLVVSVWGWAAVAQAQPSITGVTGTLSHGQTVTIAGSGFGTKSPVAPAAFEDFSDGVANGISKHGGTWHITNNTDNLRTPFDTMNARCDFKNPGGYCDYSYDAVTAPRWFVQYWFKPAPNWQWGTTTYGGGNDGLANVKYWRLFPTGARNYSNVGLAWHGFNANRTSVFVENGTTTVIDTANATLLTPGAWHLIQVAFAENSGVDQADGRLRLWIDGALRYTTDALVTNVGSDGPAVNKRPFIIGLWDSWPPSDAPVDTMYGYYSDIYVDTSWARVEVGDAPVYENCTVREIQIPSSWSASSIQITFRQGTFGNGQTVYVFVVDESGAVSPGFGVVVGSSGGSDPAPRPRVRWRIK
jgi:hypothetical protein